MEHEHRVIRDAMAASARARSSGHERAFVIRRCLHVLLVVISMQAAACRDRAESKGLERHFDALSRVEVMTKDMPAKARAGVIGAAYDELMASARAIKPLDKVSGSELESLYGAAHLTAFYTVEARHIRDLSSFLDMLQQRGLASGNHYLHMYEALVKARMLTEARELARQHPLPELEILPELQEAADLEAGTPTEWVVDPSRRALLRRSVDLHQPAQVVIVAHPLCHFSQDAMQDIRADSVLGKAFGTHARWLAPQDMRINFDTLQRWNHEHPEQEITLTFRREEWPMIDSWSTPTFYFLKDGVVSAKVEGWPKEGRRSELLAALQQVGLSQ
jgi:hypothetical protein